MTLQVVNTGTDDNDGTGDNLRVAFDKCNENFDELYALQSLTLNAAAFPGATDEEQIQSAINQAVAEGAERVFVPADMLPYDASAITFSDDVQMVREGGATDVYDIRAYGAAGNGTTDDTIAIQQAITSCAAAGGGTVHVPLGVFVSSRIRMLSRVCLVGTGWSSRLKLKAAANQHFIILDDVNVERTSIEHLSVDGNKANVTGTSSGIYYDNTGGVFTGGEGSVPRHRINDVFVPNCNTDAVAFVGTGAVGDNLLTAVWAYHANRYGFNCATVDTFYEACMSGQAGEQGFFINASNTHFVNCNAWFSGRLTVASGDGFLLDGDGTKGRVQLTGCQAQDNARHGFAVFDIKQCNLVGCYADSNGTGTTGHGFALNSCADCYVQGVSIDRSGSPTQASPLIFQNSGSITNQDNIVTILGRGSISNVPTGTTMKASTVWFNGRQYGQAASSLLVSADKGNAAATLVTGVDEPTAVWNTVLTADRAVTLSSTNAHNGAHFHIVRTAAATGAFNLNVGTGPLKALTAGTWCDVKYNGTAWYLDAYGAL